MRCIVVLGVLLTGLWPAALAHGSTLSVTQREAYGDRGGTYQVGVADLQGGAGDDEVRLSRSDADRTLVMTTPAGDGVAGTGCAGGGTTVTCALPPAGLGSLTGAFGEGNDRLVTDGVSGWFSAGPGDDDLVMSGYAGSLDGGPGDDRLEYRGAPSSLSEGTLVGGPGDDTLIGGPGSDDFTPGPGSDEVVVGPADALPSYLDDVSYQDVATPLVADLAAGTVTTEGEVDRIAGPFALLGGSADDVIVGGPGRDRLDGGPGSDRVLGGDGPDELKAVSQAGETDVLDGGPGQDRLEGIGAGLQLLGGPEDDVLSVNTRLGAPPSVDCGPDADRLDVFGIAVVAGCERVRIDPGAVTVLPGSPDSAFRARLRLNCPAGYGRPCPAVAELRTSTDDGGYLLARRRVVVRRKRPISLSLPLGTRGQELLAAGRPTGLDVQVWVRMRARRSERQVGVTVHLRPPARPG